MLTVLLNPLIRKLKFHDHQILASSILSSFFFFLSIAIAVLGFPRGSDGKESTCNVGDSDMIPGLERSPGEGNGNHSSIVTQRIPWTELPGELQSMESQRFGHNGVTNTFTFIAILLLICRFLPVGPVHL